VSNKKALFLKIVIRAEVQRMFVDNTSILLEKDEKRAPAYEL
jgi:hypothetical protein